MKKPLSKLAFLSASNDMKEEIKKLRAQSYKDFLPYDNWVVGTSHLNTSDVRTLNSLLGLDTQEGINQWYKQS